jgi:hypothetical protein
MDLSKEPDKSSGTVVYRCHCDASEPQELHHQNRVQHLLQAYNVCRARKNLNVTIALNNLSQAYKACTQCRVDFITAIDSCIAMWCICYAVLGDYEERFNLKDMELSNLVAQKRQQKQHNTTRREISRLEEERICRKRMLKCLRRTYWNEGKLCKAKYSELDDYFLVKKILNEHIHHDVKKQQELEEIISQVTTQQDEKTRSKFIEIIEMEIEYRTDMLELLKESFKWPSLCIIS